MEIINVGANSNSDLIRIIQETCREGDVAEITGLQLMQFNINLTDLRNMNFVIDSNYTRDSYFVRYHSKYVKVKRPQTQYQIEIQPEDWSDDDWTI